MLAGQLEEAVASGERLGAVGATQGMAVHSKEMWECLVWQPLVYLGRPSEAFGDESSEPLAELHERMGWLRLLPLAVCRAHAGASLQTWEELSALLRGPFIEVVAAGHLRLALEVAVLAKARDGVASLMERLGTLAATRDVHTIYNVGRLLGAGAALLGDAPGAHAHYQRGLDWATSIGFRPEIALTRLALAELLLDEALARGGSREKRIRERAEALDHLDFAIAELRAMGMAPALERALALRARHLDSAVPAPRLPLPGGLSERELEVLRLVAAGSSSQQIANELVLSIRTVESHITNIYRKIDVRTRAQATAFAHTHGLIAGG
jgi:DNA-binding CsgD family transcriptional regulator